MNAGKGHAVKENKYTAGYYGGVLVYDGRGRKLDSKTRPRKRSGGAQPPRFMGGESKVSRGSGRRKRPSPEKSCSGGKGGWVVMLLTQDLLAGENLQLASVKEFWRKLWVVP